MKKLRPKWNTALKLDSLKPKNPKTSEISSRYGFHLQPEGVTPTLNANIIHIIFYDNFKL